MFVADTNVISLSDPGKAPALAPLFDFGQSAIFLTTITVAEVRTGIHRLERIGASRKATDLALWWEEVERSYRDRILPFDHESAKVAARFADHAAAQGHKPGWADIQIAATAAARGFTVLTRNARHFAPLGVAHLDPFADELPD